MAFQAAGQKHHLQALSRNHTNGHLFIWGLNITSQVLYYGTIIFRLGPNSVMFS